MSATVKKVFVVEDENDLLDLYIEILELEGHEVLCSARNGDEAVISFRNLQERPDVILMDHRMPIKNGLEAAKEILAMDPGAKVIFASADQSIEEDAKSIGAVMFMKKPFNIESLLHNIESI